MNTKTLVVPLALLAAVGAGYLLMRSTSGTVPIAATSTVLFASSTPSAASTTGTQPTAQSSKPTFQIGSPVRTVIHESVAIDLPSLISTSPYPMITGTAKNTASIYVIVSHVNGKSITAATVPVIDGKWSYPLATALTPGTYTVTIAIDGHAVVASPLIVKSS